MFTWGYISQEMLKISLHFYLKITCFKLQAPHLGNDEFMACQWNVVFDQTLESYLLKSDICILFVVLIFWPNIYHSSIINLWICEISDFKKFRSILKWLKFPSILFHVIWYCIHVWNFIAINMFIWIKVMGIYNVVFSSRICHPGGL